MVKSEVTISRKDYLNICETLIRINADLNMYETEDNKDLVQATKNKVAKIQNLLMEDC